MRRLALALACGFACGDDVTASPDGSSGSSGVPEASSSSSEGEPPADATSASSSDGSEESGFTPVGDCGNGVLDLGETCDDGKDGDNDDECTDLCAPPTCGDGFVQAALFEHCDPGREASSECTSRCTAAQTEQWTVLEDTEIGDCGVLDVAFDPAGNVIAAGYVGTTDQGTDLWITKLSPDGRELWTRTDSGDAINGFDSATAVVIDGEEIVVAGSVQILGQSYDVWLSRLDGDGVAIWTTIENLGASDSVDLVEAATIAEDGTIYIAGSHAEPTAGLLYSAYTSTGIRLWDQVIDAPGTFDTAFAIHARGDALALAGGLADDVVVQKLEPDGTPIWSVTFDAIVDNYDAATDVYIDEQGAVFVLGSTSYIYVRKYGANGIEEWSHVYAESGSGTGGFAFDEDAIYIAGVDFVFAANRNASLRKLTLDGEVVWTQLLDDGRTVSGANAVAVQGDAIAFGGWIFDGLEAESAFVRLLGPTRFR